MDEYVKEALDIVKAQAGVRNMTEDEITSMVQSVADRLRNVESHAEGEQAQGHQQPAVDPKKAIREKSVICLECGKSFKILSKRHLATHGLTPQEYKEKWGFKKTQTLVAKALSRQRRKKMQEIQLWKKRKQQ
ncbi:MAG: MucR family transcriptional regulator [Desulfohalobiaceae bacterium]|nr:MucR family transcriptional regulator [Desulfohalobiaceae bacterium]